MVFEEASAEAAFAARLREVRTKKRMTQADIAEAMSKRGFKWHAPTVYKVENGERQIQLGEAVTLAQILGMPVEDMVTSPEFRKRMDIESAYQELLELRGNLLTLIPRYLRSTLALRKLVGSRDVEELLTPTDVSRLRGMADQGTELHTALRRCETLLMRTDE